MNIQAGIVIGLIAGAGAGYRAYKGYQAHLKKKRYEAFSWKKFTITTLPAVTAAFAFGMTYEPIPELLSGEGMTLAIALFTGGAGIGSLQGKLPFKK